MSDYKVSKFNVLGLDIDVKDAQARNDIELINSSKYIFIGDSYGDGLTPNGNVPGWCNLVPQYMGLNNDDYYSHPIGGIGFTTSPVNFKSRLMECVDHFNNNYVKFIVVCGGANDTNSNSGAIDLAISDFCSYAKEHFPNAKVLIGCVGNSTDATKRESILNVVRTAYKQCARYGAEYLTNVEYILHDYELMSRDTLHPTRYGYEVLSIGIANAIKGSLSVFNKLKSINIDNLAAGITEITGMPNVIQSNNIIQIVGSVLMINTVSFTLHGATGLKVCEIEKDSYILGSQFPYVTSFECIGYIKHSDNTFESVPFMCYFYQNEFWIEQREVTGFGFKNYADVINVTLFIPSITLNADYC